MRTAGVVLAALLLPAALPAQTPIIELRYTDLDRTQIVRGRLGDRGQLLLPSTALSDLLDVAVGDGEGWTSLDGLKEVLGPGVEVTYDPRRALLRVSDPRALLRATRAARRNQRQHARAASGARSQVGAPVGGRGPWATLVVDARAASRSRAGWQGGGWSVAASHLRTPDRAEAFTWAGSWQPLDRVWLTARDGTQRRPSLALRAVAGGLFVRFRADARGVGGRAALSVGRWTAFGTLDGGGALSFQHHSYTIALGVSPGADGHTLAGRLTWGRPTSSFQIPRVR